MLGFSVPYEDIEYKDETGVYTEESISDIMTYGAYTLPVWMTIEPTITAFFYLPTGDYSKGAGTGEISYGAGLELARTFGKLRAAIHGSYTFVEDPPGTSLSDNDLIGVDVSHPLAGELAGQIGVESFSTELLDQSEADAVQYYARLYWFGVDSLTLAFGYTYESEPTTASIVNAGAYYYF